MFRRLKPWCYGLCRYNSSNHQPPISKDGLYWGKFTKQEYENAADQVALQLNKMQSDIVGDTNVRHKLETMGLFPQRDPRGPNAAGAESIKDLKSLFEQTIQTTGPMSLSVYIRQCLTHPQFGYYTNRDPIAVATGDFITSPEVSSVFGEMIGLWLYTTWALQGNPAAIRVIEFGPGRGTLTHDVIKVFITLCKRKPVSIEINLIEASQVLRKEQWNLLCSNSEGNAPLIERDENGYSTCRTKWGLIVRWLDTEKDIIMGDSTTANYTLAHEFFDALPIKSFEKTEHGWREYLVEHTPSVVNTQLKLEANENVSCAQKSIDSSPGVAEFHLTLANRESPSSMIPKFSSRFKDLPEKSRIEVCTDAELYISKMAELINNESNLGAVMVIDYGVVGKIPDNTLRGIYQHQIVSPFIMPGEVDLSVDVDFDNLKRITRNFVKCFGPLEQGDWLHNAGIGHRIDQLIKANSKNPQQQENIYNLYRRLVDKGEKGMGKSYKFMCLMPKGSSSPLGFLS